MSNLLDRWYNRLHSVVTHALTNAVGIIALVHSGRVEHVVGIQALIERFKLAAVVGMPGSEMEGNAAVFVNSRRVDFRAQSPTRAPQSLVAAVFFGAPAACWWARTVVESINR